MKWLALILTLAFGAYATSKLLDTPAWLSLVAWVVGAALIHDLVLLPAYTALDKVAQGAARAPKPPIPAINYLRVPAVLSGILLLVYFPLILGLSDGTYERTTGLDVDVYLDRWLLLTGIAFAVSAIVYAIRLRSASVGSSRMNPGRGRGPGSIGGEAQGGVLREPPIGAGP